MHTGGPQEILEPQLAISRITLKINVVMTRFGLLVTLLVTTHGLTSRAVFRDGHWILYMDYSTTIFGLLTALLTAPWIAAHGLQSSLPEEQDRFRCDAEPCTFSCRTALREATNAK